MITIRSSAASSEPTLIGLEATLPTAHGVYTISSHALRRRFQLPFWRWSFWRHLLAPIAVPAHPRGRAGTADVFATRWISGCVLLATTRSIATVNAADGQAVLFRLRPAILSRCRFPV